MQVARSVLTMTLLSTLGCGGGGGAPRGFGPVAVAVTPAMERAVPESIRSVGTLTANERTDVAPRLSGILGDVAFTEGQRVERGQLLFCLDRDKLQARLDQAAPELKLAKANLERSTELQRTRTASQQEVDEASRTYRTALATLELRQRELDEGCVKAPFRGVIGQRRASSGQYVREGEPLAELVDDDPLKADFTVPERWASRLAVGQQIAVSVATWPGRRFPGRVYFIAPSVDPGTRTLALRALVPNAERALKPGMFADVTLTLGLRERAVVVPEAALVLQAGEARVVVVGPDDRAELRAVTPGLRLDGEVEIAVGLRAGERVVVEGHQKCGPGSPLATKPWTADAAAAPASSSSSSSH